MPNHRLSVPLLRYGTPRAPVENACVERAQIGILHPPDATIGARESRSGRDGHAIRLHRLALRHRDLQNAALVLGRDLLLVHRRGQRNHALEASILLRRHRRTAATAPSREPNCVSWQISLRTLLHPMGRRKEEVFNRSTRSRSTMLLSRRGVSPDDSAGAVTHDLSHSQRRERFRWQPWL